MRPLLLGECNPYGPDPEFALWPAPEGCSGWRLCRVILGLEPDDYLGKFDRANLLEGEKWSAPHARAAAHKIRERGHTALVLLGAKVQSAFGYSGREPFSREREGSRALFFMPHPSGRCLAWNDFTNIVRARDLVGAALRCASEDSGERRE